MIGARAHIAALSPYALADAPGAGVVSLAQNESAFAPSPAALAAGRAAVTDGALYPDPDWGELRAAISAVHGVAQDAVLCGAGSMELIGALIRAYAGPGDVIVSSQYGYAFVTTAAGQTGAQCLHAPEPALHVDTRAMAAAVTPATRIVFVCNPGNPTGTLIPVADILRLRADLPSGVMLVVDQAYGEFAESSDDPSPVFDLVARGDTVVLRTLSKAYGLAGARVGWGLFPPGIAAEVRKLLNPNNVSGVSQAMAAAALRDQDYMRDVVARTARIRDRFCADMRALGLEVPVSHTNFALLRFGTPERAQAADNALRAGGILMRGMAGYGLADSLRATVAEAPVMARATQILTEHLT